MSRHPLLIFILSCLMCGSASADDYFITHFQGDYEAIYAVPSSSITELGEGIKRAELLAVSLDRIEMARGVFVTTGSLDVMVIEVNCRTKPRQFKEDSEYVQFFRSSDPIDKTSINPYKDWSVIPTGSSMESHANFICEWPEINTEAGYTKVPAKSKWDFVDIVIDTVNRVREKQKEK